MTATTPKQRSEAAEVLAAVPPADRPIAAPAVVVGSRGAVGRTGLQTFRSLRHRDFRLLWLGILTSSAGQWMQQVGLGWLAFELTGSATWVGAVSGARAVPFLLFSLWGGVFADRFDRKRMLMASQIATVVLAAALAALVLAEMVAIWHLLLLTFLLGVVWSMNNPVRQAIMPSLIERDDLLNAVALQSMGFNLTRVVGPSVAGVLIATVGVGGVFAMTTVIYALVLITTHMMRVPARGGGQDLAGAGDVGAPVLPRPGVLSDLVAGLRYIWANPIVRSLLLMAIVPMIFAMPYIAMMPVFADRLFGMGPTGLGLLYSVSGAGSLVATFLLASLGNFRGKGLFLFGAGLVMGVALILLALSPGAAVGFVALAVVGAGSMGYMSMNSAMVQLSISDAMRGRVMSVLMADFGLTPLGALLAGVVIDLSSVHVALLYMGVVTGLFAVVAAAALPHVRRYAG